MKKHIKCGHKIKLNSSNALAKYDRLKLLMIVRQRNMNNFITALYFKEMNCCYLRLCDYLHLAPSIVVA